MMGESLGKYLSSKGVGSEFKGMCDFRNGCFFSRRVLPQKTNMTLENQPFEDVSPIKHGDFSLSC